MSVHFVVVSVKIFDSSRQISLHFIIICLLIKVEPLGPMLSQLRFCVVNY